MKAPFDLPADCFALQQFELQRVDYTAATADGRVGGVQAGFPLWSLVGTLTGLTAEKSDEVRAWFQKCRGATRRFLGCDQSRPYPKAYPRGVYGMVKAGGGTFDGSASSWSESITADGDSQVTLNGLPASFVFSVGDYVGFQWTATEDSVAGLTWYALVRVIEAATANSSGVAVVTCEPPIPTAVPDTATAHLDNPKCVMALITDQSSLEAIDARAAVRGGQIVGIQDIRS